MFRSKILSGSVFMLLATCPLHASTLLSEGFDNIATLAGSGWAMLNASAPAGTSNWFQGQAGIFTSQQGADTAYIAANFNNAAAGGNISNWLISPVLSLQDSFQLSFYTRTEASSAFPDNLQVLLSSNGASTTFTDFSLLFAINPTLAVGGYPEAWQQFTSNFAGLGVPSTGRIAFRYVVPDTNTNGNYIGIDTVSADTVLAAIAPEPGTLSLLGVALGIAAMRRRLARSV